MKRILITGHGAEALAANYVLADLGYSPTLVTPYPHARATMFDRGPWRHTGNSPLLARVLEDLDITFSEHTMTVSLDGEDWSGRRVTQRARFKAGPTLFDRFLDIKRVLGGDAVGFSFERGRFVNRLRNVASLPSEAIRGRAVGAVESSLGGIAVGVQDGFEHRVIRCDALIVTDIRSLQAIENQWSGETIQTTSQLVYRLEATSFPNKRFDASYYAEGDVIRVSTVGEITYVQARGMLDAEELEVFGGKRARTNPVISGLDLEGQKPYTPSLPPNVYLLGPAATNIDQTISDVMETAHNWGKQW